MSCTTLRNQHPPLAAKMEKLPQELLRPIVCNQSRKDLFSLRLVNTSLAAATTPFLFETIPLWINAESLEVLTKFSEHPERSRYVKKIVISPLRLIDYHDAPIYQDKARAWLAAERDLTANKMDLKLLIRTLAAFRELDTINLDYRSSIGAAQLFRTFGEVDMKDLLTCDCEYVLPLLFQALHASGTTFRTFQLGLREEVNGKSRKLPTEPFPCGISTTALTQTFNAPNIIGSDQAVSGLRELDIRYIVFDTNPRQRRVEESDFEAANAAIHNLIAFAPLLEQISLGGFRYDRRDKLCFSTIFDGLVLERLNILRLGSVKTSAEELESLLSVHAGKLKEVHLTSVDLAKTYDRDYFQRVSDDKTKWPNFLKSLRKKVNLTVLTRFTLSSCDSIEKMLEVQDYILCKTELDPILAWRLKKDKK